MPSPIAAVPPFLRLGDTDENSKRLSAYDFLFMLIANSGSVSWVLKILMMLSVFRPRGRLATSDGHDKPR